MKPLNLDNRPCSPISSNCVIWQGPDIPCIKICNGDTVSDIVYKLGTELCTIMDQLNVSNYDLSCFSLAACPPEDFQALIQLLIDRVCTANGVVTDTTKSTSGCPDCVVSVAPCFVQGTTTTMQLTDYVQMIANRVCSIVSEIASINEQISVINNTLNDLQTQIDNLPAFTLPTVTVGCLLTPGAYSLQVALDAIYNNTNGYCNLLAATGNPSDIVNAVQSQCVVDGDLTLSDPAQTFAQVYLGTWVPTALTDTVADAINNIWIVLCDMYTYLNSSSLTVTNTSSVNLDFTSGVLTAHIQDTGWHNLEGFDFYTGAIAAFKPQCRRIGNQIHFRGVVYIPLATSVTGTTVIDLTNALTYSTSTQITPFIGIGGMYTDTSGFMYFNSNGGSAAQSVIPTNVLSAGTLIDNEYRLTNVLGFRKIVIGGSNITSLISNLGISITTDKKLKITSVDVFDAELSYAILNASSLRLVTSNVRSGEYIPNYITAASDINNAPSNANFPLVSDTYNLTWPFSCDASKTTNLGGFTFVLDGLTAYIDHCTEDIKNYNCIPV